MNLTGKTILVTGGARRVGAAITLAAAEMGANVIIHYSHFSHDVANILEQVQKLGVQAWTLQADFNDPTQVDHLVEQAWKIQPLYALVNNAAIFEPLDLNSTNRINWQNHLEINLSAPFFLSQAFARHLGKNEHGRIINILDWRALRPGSDHFPYTISKAALAALTQSMAASLAPNITVNGLALGAILPPADGKMDLESILVNVPAGRWAMMEEVKTTVKFLLEGPAYITGEIFHLDGGRHLI